MSLLFGKVCQNGYVVRDIEAAMKFWTGVMRVGPFFYIPKVKTDWFRSHRCRRTACPGDPAFGARDRAEKPRRTGSPAFAGDDNGGGPRTVL